jgi:hypothetical protein
MLKFTFLSDQDVISRSANLYFNINSSAFVNIAVWKFWYLDKYVFRCGKIYSCNTIIAPIFMSIHVQKSCFKISSLSKFAIRCPKRILIWCLGNNWIPALIPHRLPLGGGGGGQQCAVRTLNHNKICLARCMWHVVTKNLYSLKLRSYVLYQIKPYLNDNFLFT